MASSPEVKVRKSAVVLPPDLVGDLVDGEDGVGCVEFPICLFHPKEVPFMSLVLRRSFLGVIVFFDFVRR